MADNKPMKSIAMIVIAFAGVLCAIPAHASIDQHCLSQCIAGGDNASVCMDKCTYTGVQDKPKSKAIPNPSATNKIDPHNIVEAPRPVGGEILLQPKQQSKEKARGKDYVCLNNCLQDGGQYALCSRTCTKSDCAVGDASCQGLTGNATPSSSAGFK